MYTGNILGKNVTHFDDANSTPAVPTDDLPPIDNSPVADTLQASVNSVATYLSSRKIYIQKQRLWQVDITDGLRVVADDSLSKVVLPNYEDRQSCPVTDDSQSKVVLPDSIDRQPRK